MSITESIKNEYNKICEMDRHKRWDYYKTYYLKATIIAVIGLALFAWFIKDTFFQQEPVSMGCAYGVELTDEQKYTLTDGYMDYYGYNPKKCDAYVSTDNMFEGTQQQMDANGQEMALFAQIAAGQIYYLILDESTMNLYLNGGIYAGLDEVLPADLIDGLNDAVINLTDPETNESYRAAIDLKKIGFLTEDWQEGYLIYTIARPDDEYPVKLLQYLLDKGTK